MMWSDVEAAMRLELLQRWTITEEIASGTDLAWDAASSRIYSASTALDAFSMSRFIFVSGFPQRSQNGPFRLLGASATSLQVVGGEPLEEHPGGLPVTVQDLRSPIQFDNVTTFHGAVPFWLRVLIFPGKAKTAELGDGPVMARSNGRIYLTAFTPLGTGRGLASQLLSEAERIFRAARIDGLTLKDGNYATAGVDHGIGYWTKSSTLEFTFDIRL